MSTLVARARVSCFVCMVLRTRLVGGWVYSIAGAERTRRDRAGRERRGAARREQRATRRREASNGSVCRVSGVAGVWAGQNLRV